MAALGFLRNWHYFLLIRRTMNLKVLWFSGMTTRLASQQRVGQEQISFTIELFYSLGDARR